MSLGSDFASRFDRDGDLVLDEFVAHCLTVRVDPFIVVGRDVTPAQGAPSGPAWSPPALAERGSRPRLP